MEELYELRAYLEQGKYPEALILLGEMEEMGRDDKVNKVTSFLEILLLHLIKQQAEKRTTRSWDVSIHNAVTQIKRTNKRHKAGGNYLSRDELMVAAREAYDNALSSASLEAFGGVYNAAELAEMVDEDQIQAQAIRMILEAQ